MDNLTPKHVMRSLMVAVGLLIMCVIGIMLLLFNQEAPVEQGIEKAYLHNYDYVIEISGDSTIENVYTVYDYNHNYVGECKADGLDSLMYYDNL